LNLTYTLVSRSLPSVTEIAELANTETSPESAYRYEQPCVQFSIPKHQLVATNLPTRMVIP